MDKVTTLSPTVIIVVGLPGSGKSFFATQYATSLGAPLVSEDKIRWTLFAHHTHNDNENIVVKQVANIVIAELLKTGKTFILDGGYNDRATRATLIAQAKKARYTVLTVVVQTDAPTAKQRSTKRLSKKAGDFYKQSLTPQLFETQSKKYQPPLHIDKAVVVISGKHTYSTQARIVSKKILETQVAATPIARLHGPFAQ